MKGIIFYLLLFLIFTNCTHRIVRTGYQINKADYNKCDIVIKKSLTNIDSLKKVGEIKLGESGFSVVCSEAHAIDILIKEGCALKADLIYITEESRPDLWSSCYRCRAEFYSYKYNETRLLNEEGYKPEKVEKRVSEDRARNTVIAILAITGGFLAGFFLVPQI